MESVAPIAMAVLRAVGSYLARAYAPVGGNLGSARERTSRSKALATSKSPHDTSKP